ncbi:hypothetical protein CICLE_v10006158mg [Citrus x clementina]|uniref:Uncharacterized protein n=1 Tax=Citrus clementina TaxID=85681 RepID=V4SBF2_CITCL|nr:hypothetical protein CICLE_v10006158mg [Citrus x clementina]
MCSRDKLFFPKKPKKFEEGSVEESAQSTPPDIDLFVDTKEAEENGNPNVGFVPEKQSNKIDQKNSRIKSFLRPCFRVKLFKAPGSFSYRRLLPYLMDISEENSSNPPAPPLVSDYQERPLGNPKGNDYHAEHHTGHYNALPISAADAS